MQQAFENWPSTCEGINRAWDVVLSHSSEEDRGTLEIMSVFSDYPRPADVVEDAKHELWYILYTDGPPQKGTYDHQRWIDEVSDPAQFLTGGVRFRIETWQGGEESAHEYTEVHPRGA